MSKSNLTLVTVKTKFTPGPWRFTPPGPADSKGYGVCALWGEPGSVEQIANNHLISAAPEMYEMLSSLSEMSSEDAKLYLENASYITELLAKARGES